MQQLCIIVTVSFFNGHPTFLDGPRGPPHPPHVAGPMWRAPNWRQLQPILDWKNQNLGSDQLAIIWVNYNELTTSSLENHG